MRGHKQTVRSVITLVIALTPLHTLRAQNDCGDECRINSNLGVVVNVPVNPTAQVADIGWGTSVGVGYNFSKRHALIGEFMWNRIYPSHAALQALQGKLQSGSLSGSTDLFVTDAVYRLELRGRLLGTYVIGGGGWYFRSGHLSKAVTSDSATVCTPIWLWWGFTCGSGEVTPNQTVASSSLNSLGGNAGLGFSARVGEAPYRLYTEARYHYAPTRGIKTQFTTITFGIRY